MSLSSLAVTYTTTTTPTSTFSGVLVVVLIVVLLIALVLLVGAWKMYAKAGKPGWGVLIPIYNVYLLAKIGGKPGWWGIVAALVAAVPFVGWIISIIMTIIMAIGVGRNFGKGDIWSVILLWIIPVGQAIIGYGKAQYIGDGQVYGGFSLPPAPGQQADTMPPQSVPVTNPQPPVTMTPPATPDPVQQPQQPVGQTPQPPTDQQPPQTGAGPQGPIVG